MSHNIIFLGTRDSEKSTLRGPSFKKRLEKIFHQREKKKNTYSLWNQEA